MAKRLEIKQLVPLGDGLVALTECGRMFHKKAPIDFDGEQDRGEDWYEVEPVTSDNIQWHDKDKKKGFIPGSENDVMALGYKDK